MNWRLVLVLAALAVAYAWWAYAHPWRDCPRCKGARTNPGSSGRRWGKCRRCKGHGEVKTIGAAALHRAVRSIVQHYRDREGK
ncbi:MAG: hypothetical protein ACRDNF_20115 [Streptosporangiaceae bacterium]